MKFETPILFLVYNRPTQTNLTFKSIRSIKPSKLYISADGPRANSSQDRDLSQQVKKIVSNIDWECDVKYKYESYNMGCGAGVKSGIDWLFENEKLGIILEDDVLAEETFFTFCEELLLKYRDDERISMIAGTNHIQYEPSNFSYFFSKNKACWGWATWKRAWKNMDYEMNWRDGFQSSDVIQNMSVNNRSLRHWRRTISLIDAGKVNAWDWQWYFSVASQNQLTIFPSVNLVSNIGFGESATHTKGKAKTAFLISRNLNFPLKHPEFVCPDFTYDILFEKQKTRTNNAIIRFITYALLKVKGTVFGENH